MVSTAKAAKSMAIGQVREKAQALGITPGKMKKKELIHAVQVAEGFTPCFGTSNGQCGYIECCFRADCLKIKS